jgi:hypothetical protein
LCRIQLRADHLNARDLYLRQAASDSFETGAKGGPGGKLPRNASMIIRNLLISFCLLIAPSAFAAPPPGADMTLAPWYRSLLVPGAKTLCCDISDCRHYPVQADGTHYQVFFDKRWLIVPTEAVSDRGDNPTGDYVTCIQRDHWTNGVPDGPRILCLFKAPRM